MNGQTLDRYIILNTRNNGIW